MLCLFVLFFFFFQAEDGIRDLVRSRGLGDVYKRQFWSITLPLLRPTIAVALVFRTLDAVRVFDLFQIVLAQKRYSMASYAYYEPVSYTHLTLPTSDLV